MEFLIREYQETVGHYQSLLDAAKNSFSLQISKLFLNDSSTYYCAASHSDAHRADTHTNNSKAPHIAHQQEGAVAHLVLKVMFPNPVKTH